MKLLNRWVTTLAVIALDRIGALTKERCNAYGGHQVGLSGARLCIKWRWHTDSHAYEWEHTE